MLSPHYAPFDVVTRVTSLLRGRGTFLGKNASVTLRRANGPVRLSGVPLAAYHFVPALRTTTIEAASIAGATDTADATASPPARRVGTVEHLLAAFGGLGIHAGVAIDVDGDELPFLDGAAARWCTALAELGVPRSASRLVVAREGEIHVGASQYRFLPAPEGRSASHAHAHEEEQTSVAVTLEFDHPHLVRHASWDGDPHDFVLRIAPARTFLFADELVKLADAGMMAHVDPESVVIIDEHQAHAAGTVASWDEPARHKLLDLVGDLFLHGGPPKGRIEAFRPGHAATHEAMGRARVMGIVVDR